MLSLIPTNQLSWAIGKLAHLRLPALLNQPLIRAYARFYGIDCSEAAQPLSFYRSLGEFFVREIRPELRPIGSAPVVSPVDGLLRSCGAVRAARVENIKGRSYSLADLLGEPLLAERYEGGTFYNFYLSPRDCHLVFSPIDGRVTRVVYIPGSLFPVNDWGVTNIENLYGINERVAIIFEGDLGTAALVLVGAANVGCISLEFAELRTNQLGIKPRRRTELDFDKPRGLRKGERLGAFRLGSAAVLLFEPGKVASAERALLRTVKYGEGL